MIVYRICQAGFSTDLTGSGAMRYGGRWNTKGNAVLYTSSSRALATVEFVVHLRLGNSQDDFRIVTIEIPDGVFCSQVNVENLNDNWKSFPFHFSTQRIGNDWLRSNGSLVLQVPSVVVPQEFNFLINPQHEDFHLVKVVGNEPFLFDKRLIKSN
jgi:RES domain-containing protein